MEGLVRLKSPLLSFSNPVRDDAFTMASPATTCVMSVSGMRPIRESGDWESEAEGLPLQGPLLGLVKAGECIKDMAASSPDSSSAHAAPVLHVVPPDDGTANSVAAAVGTHPPPEGLGGGGEKTAVQSREWGASLAGIRDAAMSFKAPQHAEVAERSWGLVNLVSQSREWSALDGSRLSGDSELPPVADKRQQRYAREVPLSPGIGFPARHRAASGIAPNVLRFWSWSFFFVEMWFSLACLALFLHRRHWVAVACLVPPHLLFLCIEVHLLRHDRAFLQQCRALLHGLGPLGAGALQALAVAVCGCLNCFSLIRAKRCWRQRGMQLSVVDEIEAQGVGTDGARVDSHLLFVTGVPRMVVLTNILTGHDSYAFSEVAVICVLAVLSLISVVQAVMSFDYYASRWVRMQYEREHLYRFHAVHYAYRLFEVAGRILVLVAVTKALHYNIPSVTAVLLLDYILGIIALLWVTGFAPGSPQMILVLSVSIYVVDVCRYIDEHGITRQAKKVSKFFYWIRNLQLWGVLLLYFYFKARPLVHESKALPLLAIIACGACLAIRKFTRMGHTGIDMFVASKHGHADLLQEILESGCNVNMVQKDNTLETALHTAARRGQAPCARVLLQHGADPLLQDARGENPLHRACRQGNAQIIQMLLSPPPGSPCTLREDYLQSVVQVNNSGMTPLQVLRKNSPWVLAQMLVEAQQNAACMRRSEDSGLAQQLQLSRSISAEVQAIAERVFGRVVGGGRARFHVGAGEAAFSSAGPGLASFMFSTGIGEQLAEYLDSDDGQGQKVQLSSLRMQGVLGAGAFGRVFKVKDVETGEIYALKLQRRERTTKFAVREAQALHQSSHAFIVRLVQIFQTQNFYGLLMELCNKSLNACILEASGPGGRAEGLPEAKATRYAACITLALEYLHGLETIFRDLKPDNVLLTLKEKGDVAKLTDFGLARSIKPPQGATPKAQAGRSPGLEEEEALPGSCSPLYASAVCGTPRFMAPEVFDEAVLEDENAEQRLRRLTSRDWYALGCTLQLMLLGEDGGIKVHINGRDVLLPPTPAEMLATLLRAAKAFRIDEGAYQLLASLTAPVTERADAAFVRACPFMRGALAEMEAEACRYESP